MADITNIATSLSNTTQFPIYAKEYFLNEAALKDLGLNNNKAFTYEQGLKVYCIEENKRYEWLPISEANGRTGLLVLDYTYPDNLPTIFGINYSNKAFNFYPLTSSGSNGNDGAAATIEIGTVTTGLAGSNANVTNSGTENEAVFNFTIPRGDKGDKGDAGEPGTNGIDAAANLQRVVTSSFILSNTDNNYTIMVQSDEEITITIPTGLLNKICVAFCQTGFQDIIFDPDLGVTINTPVGLKIKDINYAVCLEQIGTTNEYQLMGNTKI